MTLDSQSLKMSVTSTGSNAAGSVPLSSRMPLILMSMFCLFISFWTYSGRSLSSWTPLISMRAPPGTEMFRSSLMVPMPRLTFLVALSRVPILSATSMTSSGSCMSGPVATSMRGIPSLSSLYVISASVVSTLRHASSSRQMERMEISLPLTSTEPFMDTNAVLWKPEVLEPSTTIFLMKCISSTTRAFIISEKVSVVARASELVSCGGSSSSSTRHDTPGADWYLYPRFLWNCASAARSTSPISLVVGLSLL